MSRTAKSCIYCDGVLRQIGKGEHIIPKALGSTAKIRCVCGDCNNEFSVLDKHLLMNSPIYLIHYRIHGTKGGHWYEIDKDDDNLIIQVCPNRTQTSWPACPQIIFCEGGTQIRGDHEGFLQLGTEAWQDVFFTNLCAAYQRRVKGDNRAIIFSRYPGMSSQGRYPPRVFAERSIHEFGAEMRFMAHYEKRSQRRQILTELAKLTPKKKIGTVMRTAMGSRTPGGRMSGDAITTYRALTKIGINALAFTCEKTQVDRYEFREAIRFVQRPIPYTNPKRYLARCGFVSPAQLESLCCPNDAHLLHFCHYDVAQLWQMYFVFYGGAAGGRIEFPGPSQEMWKSTTMIAPFRGDTKAWIQKRYGDIVAPQVDIVSWNDDEFFRKVVPSVAPAVSESGALTIRRSRQRR